MRASFTNRSKSPTPPNCRKSAADLSKILLAPAAAELGSKRLLIVADNILQYIPFAALPNPQSGITNPKSNEPLIVSNEIIYLPSASTLAALREAAAKPASKTIAVIADPVFDPDDTRILSGRGKSTRENRNRRQNA